MATAPPTNVAPFTLEELGALAGARWIRRGSRAVSGVSTDTRTLGDGNAFVALVGERFDGHLFLAKALERGAAALIVSDEASLAGLAPLDVSILIVPDTLVALGQLGHAHRERMEREGSLRLVVAITGSVGKTTTKEMCGAVLEALGHRTLRTAGNLNNRIGVPLTLLALEPSHAAAVFEIGMNVPGEIALLTELARPHVGVVSAVAAVHTEGVGTLEGVAREKSSLVTGLHPSPARVSAAIYTVDDRIVVPLAQASSATTHVRVGRHEEADVRLLARRARGDGGADCLYAIRPPGTATTTELALQLRMLGEGAARNAGLAIALALVAGGAQALDAATAALGALEPGEGRGAPVPGLGGTLVIDDAYNASRRSVINALEAASELAAARQGRIVAVLGDMLELGAYEEEEHLRVGEAVARVGTSLFVACGARMRIAAEEAREMGADLVVEESDPLAAVPHVRDFAAPGDVIVVKGSRSMGMERVVAALRARPEPRPFDDHAADEGGER
ncbi:MAG: UDP-N-acetylmuramoyl-tripeptide--D-alanyl-D-alanine ligase [Deltaproteobacteria bacterium]|jgi:UDP-N-acetylmuramoyl-tripeptide--D-alanyl-D-alanine ligase